MSPFIVTVKRGLPDTTDLMARLEASLEKPSCVAVATPDDAHEAAREACLLAPGSVEAIAQAIREVFALGELGGTVTLPDGTTVAVEPVFHPRMRRDLRVWGSPIDTVRAPSDIVALRWVAAFNARERIAA